MTDWKKKSYSVRTSRRFFSSIFPIEHQSLQHNPILYKSLAYKFTRIKFHLAKEIIINNIWQKKNKKNQREDRVTNP